MYSIYLHVGTFKKGKEGFENLPQPRPAFTSFVSCKPSAFILASTVL